MSSSTPWRSLRRAARLAFVFCATATLAAAWFSALPFCARSPRRRRALRGFVFSRWSRACLFSLGVHLSVTGDPPRERCYLVSNHLSYVDILVFSSRLNCVFVSMAEVLDWPFIGRMADSFGTVFIDRKKKRDIPDVNREMESFLDQDFIVVLFPEGRSSRGERVEEFRTSLLEPAADSEHPVASATIHYSTASRDVPASSSVCWTDPNFLAHAMRQLLCDRIDATLTFHPAVPRDPNRKQLAQELHKRVSASFTPLV